MNKEDTNQNKKIAFVFSWWMCSVQLICIMIYYIAPALAAESSTAPTIKDQESIESIGSTLEKRNVLEDDPTRQSLFPSYHYKLRSWRNDIEKKLKMEVLLSYDMLFQGYAEGNTSMGASAGDFTFSGRRLFFGKKYLKPVYLSFRMRYRHAYGSSTPSQISSREGMLWKTVDGFTDAGFQIPDFYVSQELADKRLMLHYGQFSINEFFDKHKLRSAKRYFLNQAFSANPAIFFPSHGAGFVVQWKDSRNWDLSIGGSNMKGFPKVRTFLPVMPVPVAMPHLWTSYSCLDGERTQGQ